jgi:hypothetical protein
MQQQQPHTSSSSPNNSKVVVELYKQLNKAHRKIAQQQEELSLVKQFLRGANDEIAFLRGQRAAALLQQQNYNASIKLLGACRSNNNNNNSSSVTQDIQNNSATNGRAASILKSPKEERERNSTVQQSCVHFTPPQTGSAVTSSVVDVAKNTTKPPDVQSRRSSNNKNNVRSPSTTTVHHGGNSSSPPQSPHPFFGLEVADGFSTSIVSIHGGAIKVVKVCGPAKRSGMEPNDLITHVNDTRVQDLMEFSTCVSGIRAGDVVRFVFDRDGHIYSASIQTEATEAKPGSLVNNGKLNPPIPHGSKITQIQRTTTTATTTAGGGSPTQLITPTTVGTPNHSTLRKKRIAFSFDQERPPTPTALLPPFAAVMPLNDEQTAAFAMD